VTTVNGTVFSAEVAAALLTAIREEEGEICGFLLAPAAGGARQRFERCRNDAEQEGTFLVEEDELARVERLAARDGLAIRAFVHSQAGGVRLGDAGRQALDRSPWPWLVVSTAGGELVVAMYQGSSVAS
jgi:proteasome lid subunit RPN8/RPN11